MNWWNAILPVITLLVGFAANYLGDWGKENRADKRARTARSFAREDRRDAFELDVLQELSTKLGHALEHALRSYADNTAALGHQPIGDEQYPITSPTYDGEEALTREVERLQDLVLIPAIRQSVRATSHMVALLRVHRGTWTSAAQFVMSSRQLATSAQGLIAGRIREIYGGDHPGEHQVSSEYHEARNA